MGAGSYHDIQRPGLHDKLHIFIVKAKLGCVELESKRPFFTRSQSYPFKSSQLLDWPDYMSLLLMVIKL